MKKWVYLSFSVIVAGVILVSITNPLRTIYANADNEFDAETLLNEWCITSKNTGVNELLKMVRTIENHMDGILSFWRNNRLTNAHMEGFNL